MPSSSCMWWRTDDYTSVEYLKPWILLWQGTYWPFLALPSMHLDIITIAYKFSRCSGPTMKCHCMRNISHHRHYVKAFHSRMSVFLQYQPSPCIVFADMSVTFMFEQIAISLMVGRFHLMCYSRCFLSHVYMLTIHVIHIPHGRD